MRPNQKDQDSLPEYDQLDAILRLYIEENQAQDQIISQGFSKEVVQRVITLVNRNDYKRAQVPPILKMSKKAFGNGRKYPY